MSHDGCLSFMVIIPLLTCMLLGEVTCLFVEHEVVTIDWNCSPYQAGLFWTFSCPMVMPGTVVDMGRGSLTGSKFEKEGVFCLERT